jgi:chitodextrinase
MEPAASVVAAAPPPTGAVRPSGPAVPPISFVPSPPSGPGAPPAPAEPARLAAPDLTAPSRPGLPAARARPGRIELTWPPATDDVGVVAYELLRDGAVVARVTGTSASEQGRPAAVPSCYSVRAVDQAGNGSAPSPLVCATPPDVLPPTVPEGVRARADAETELSLGWSAARDDVGVARYEVMRQEQVIVMAAGLEAVVTGLRAGVEYCHAVRACDAAGNCSPPSAPACAVTPDRTPPGAPAAAAARADFDRQVTVTWAPASDNVAVVGYQVRRSDGPVLRAPGDAVSMADGSVRPAVQFCYQVVALDAAGNASPPSPTACATPPDQAPPTVPAHLRAGARSADFVGLAWDPSTDDVGVAGYEVLRGTDVIRTVQGTGVEFTGLAPETSHCYVVQAFDAAGNRSRPSGEACARTGSRTDPVGPWNLKVRRTSPGEVGLAWDPSPSRGVVYTVYWSDDAGDRLIGMGPQPSYLVTGKAATERHCYRASARDAEGRESPRTLPVCEGVAR